MKSRATSAQKKKARRRQVAQKPVNGENVPSWNIPGKSPSHPGSVYNGMFGVFKGYNIKGVLLHHGYNNAMTGNCRPEVLPLDDQSPDRRRA
jgi:sialate O-acetylesterase